MSTNRTRTQFARHSGFTLVELLIVVIILAILAAVVVPQFTTSTTEARSSAADTTLGNMRASIDLYFAQHGEYPSRLTDGTNAVNTPLAFTWQLARVTDGAGDALLTPDATHVYGPYIKKELVPLEPITDSSVLEIESVSGALGMVATAGDPGGWKFNNQTGQFIINHSSWDGR